jgi:uncharacterized protein YkwD
VGFRHGRPLLPLAGAFAIAAALLLPAWSVPPALAAGAADAQASELVGLINGERAYAGKGALRLDSYLAAKARDGTIWCPNDASKTMAGRAKDIAVSGYFSHELRLCTQYTIIDAMKTWGYKGGRGEILTYNSGFGVGTITYRYGCRPGVTSCPGGAISTSSTTARAMTGWMQSSAHYSIILGRYDRVGCGAWVGSSGTYYYACLFALGGNPIATPKPKATPRPPAAGGEAPPPAATPVPGGPTQPPPWPSPSGAAAWIVMPELQPYPSPPADAADAVPPASESPIPTPDAAARAGTARAGSAPGSGAGLPSGLPPEVEGALAAGGFAATVIVAWLGMLRGPRRLRGRPSGGATG